MTPMIPDVLDLHTHTIASGHAYNTIYEMAYSASQKGVQLLGISDHGPAMEGAASSFYFRASRRVPRSLYGIQLLFGAELNILDYDGKLDLDDESAAPLDYVIASLHVECIKPGSTEDNTAAYLGAMKNPRVMILGHPDDGTFVSDYERIAYEAASQKVLIEMNEASFRPGTYRKNTFQNAKDLLLACRKYKTGIVVSSDAHIETDILQHKHALELLEEVEYPQEWIINTSVEKALQSFSDRREYVKREGRSE